ncbi:PTS system cellobiose-specific IIB component [Microbacterium endophyticum]|uniref:PTS system cellobiose-specific IIB component n=1 Tax=Microbacterium endophyticum TaxID=1526412 RepID=A0A7W4YME2_9MICO|nr:PTS sugar transporter [Microbacterium endophyticum]MBB2976375.1 PTS system cellobiose-specific IIB component [Microbacterium endophyticum]NIK35256.1 PTS system cellobiose-specific IIB component [Microbacterium endophyticum]
MRILVVCGAGASSTFVAQRLRHAARARDLSYSSSAGTLRSLEIDLDATDVLLLGPHLKAELDNIAASAASKGVTVAVLPDDIFGDLDGSRTLALVHSAIGLSKGEPALSHVSEKKETE